MWWTYPWVARFFTGEFDPDKDIPAAMKWSSTMAFIVATWGGIEWIAGIAMIMSDDDRMRLVAIFLAILGTGALLAAVIMERIELMIFMLLWDKRREQKEELRRLDAADL